jgi:hypothetical protein
MNRTLAATATDEAGVEEVEDLEHDDGVDRHGAGEILRTP